MTSKAPMEYLRFGETIRMIRKEKGISQTELSELAGCDRSYVSMVECGKSLPTLMVMNELCTALGWRVHQVLEIVESGIEIQND